MKRAFVNSLPKSGTNLPAKCLLLFGYRERGHLSAGTLLDRNFRARLRRRFWVSRDGSGYALGVNSPVWVRRRPVDAILRRVGEGSFITAHAGGDGALLDSVLAHSFVAIQVVRDPRAVLASFVPYVLGDENHFLHRMMIALPDDTARYSAVLSGVDHAGTPLRPLGEWCRAFDPWIESPSVYRVRFEDIVGAAGGGSDARRSAVLDDLVSLLDLPPGEVARVSDELFGPGRHTFRKGRIDSWKEELPPEIVDQANDSLADVLMRWGYSA